MIPSLRRKTLGAVLAAVVLAAVAAAFVPGVRGGPFAALHPTGGFTAGGEFKSEGVDSLAGPRYASWSGSDAQTGYLTSDPFPAGFALAVAYSGYPSIPGERIIVERLDGNGSLALELPDAGERWLHVVYPLPLGWVGRPVRIVAADQSTAWRSWIGVADVRPASLAQAAGADVRLRLVGDLAFVALLVLPALYGATMLRCYLRLPRALLFAVLLLLGGIGAEATFFLTMLDTRLAAGAVVLATLAGAALTAYALRSARFRTDLAHPDSWAPFAAAAIAALAYTGIACVQLNAASSPIYSIGAWLNEPDDNILPFIMSLHTAEHAPPKPFVREWLSSDRPPLQAGFDLALRAVTPFVRDGVTRYVALSIALQAAAMGMVFVLARVSGCSVPRAAAVTSLALCSGFFLENTVFVWPKLIAAAYVMVAIAFAFAPGRLTPARAAAIGAAVALGMLCHGGVAFNVPALVLGLLIARRRQALAPLALAACALFVLYAPWTAYQHFYDPPGDRLLKWHLGGHVAPTDEPLGHLMRRSYTEVPAATIVGNKISNFAVTLGGEGTSTWPPISREKLELRYVAGALSLPYVIALVWGFFSRRITRRRAGALAWLGLGGAVFWCLAMYGPQAGVIPNGSYATVVLLFAAGGLIATEWWWLYAVVLAAQVYDFASVWLTTLAPSGGVVLGSLAPLVALAGIAAIAASIGAVSAAARQRRQDAA